MKTATKATSTFRAKFRELVDAGWTLRNYGRGWRYFSRPRDDGSGLHDCLRVNTAGTVTETLDPQMIR